MAVWEMSVHVYERERAGGGFALISAFDAAGPEVCDAYDGTRDA